MADLGSRKNIAAATREAVLLLQQVTQFCCCSTRTNALVATALVATGDSSPVATGDLSPAATSQRKQVGTFIIIVLFLYKSQKEINLFNSLVSSIYANGIFFTVSNLGHYVFFSESYTIAALLMSYTQAVPFGWNLMLSTVLFIGIYHLLLAVNKKRLVKA